MSVRVFVGGARLTLDERLGIPEAVHDMRVLVQLPDGVQEYCRRRELGKDEKVNGVLKLVVSLLENIFKEDLLEDERLEAIMFLKEQCQLLMCRSKRCSAELLILPTVFYTISLHGYNFLRSSGNIVLPHPSTIKRVCATHDVSPLNEQNQEGLLRYMKRKASLLKLHERHVTLMLDEIRLQQFFDYKAGRLTGVSVNSTEPVKTAHVFTVQSLLSAFKDVAHILPVSKISAEELHKVLRK
nr:uncharacterized protein LOC119181614 [Rhipicephalus microplus]